MRREYKGFIILDKRQAPKCFHHFIEHIIEGEETINPNGEYVVGYGHAIVSIATKRTEFMCDKCGYIKKRNKPKTTKEIRCQGGRYQEK